MRKPTNSAMGTVSRMRWPRPTAGRYCAQSGIRGVVNLLGKVPDKQSVDKLEFWVWDQVYTLKAIPVLCLAMCMVMDVVFPVKALVANLLAALWRGFVWLRAMLIHRGVHAGFFECCLQGGCKESLVPRVLLVSRIRDACSVRFAVNGFGASIVHVSAGHSGVYFGKARLDRKRMCGMGPRALEHLRALLSTNVRDGMNRDTRSCVGLLGLCSCCLRYGVTLK